MKKITVAAFLLVCLAMADLCSGWSAKCLYVKFGNSIVVEYQGTLEEGEGKERIIRLYGVDAPKKKQNFSAEATGFTKAMVEGKTVEVQVIDCYYHHPRCRLVAWVSVDGKSLNKELVSAGWAWYSKRYAPNDQELQELQERQGVKREVYGKTPILARPGNSDMTSAVKTPRANNFG